MLARFRRLVDGSAPPYRRNQTEEPGRGRMAVRRGLITFATAVLLIGVVASDARAEEPFYKGKRLTVLVNFAAGGPADIESRIFAKHLVKHIDGQPALIVQNMDGAGGLIGAQYLGEIAPKDGTMLGALTGTAWIYASDPGRWRVDFRSYEFVARQASTTIHFVRTDVPPGIKEPADIVKAQGLIAGGLSADTSKDLRLRLALDMLGIPFKYVTGYRSSPPARLALQRGEIHMFSESPPSYRSIVVPELVTPGIAIPVFYDEVIDPPPPQKQMEGLTIPTFQQLYRQIKGTAPSGQYWEAYRTLYEMNNTLLRLVALPPGAPRAAYEAIARAVERVNHDPEFAAEAMKVMEFVPEYETAPDLTEKVRAMLVVSPEMRTYINEYTRNVPKR
jgi:tripartite-type tricarboxylate transporter receptor subunit TctC